MALYTTWGSVRGCCGHEHRTEEAAEACASKDQRACARVGGYSDRKVRKISRGETEGYIVDEGPGKPVDHGWNHI